MSRRHHVQIGGGGQEIIFNAPLDEVNTSKDLISGVNGTVTSGTFDTTTHSVSGSAVRYNGIVRWDLNGQAFPTKVQAAYTNGKTIGVSWEMYCTSNTNYATPFTIGTWGSTNNSTRLPKEEGLKVDPRGNYVWMPITRNLWVTITYYIDLQNAMIYGNTSEGYSNNLSTPTISVSNDIVRYVNIFGKCWSGGGTWTGKMRNVLIWTE